MDEEALKDVYAEFAASFDDSSKNINRTWVKGGLANPKSTSLYLIEITSCCRMVTNCIFKCVTEGIFCSKIKWIYMIYLIKTI